MYVCDFVISVVKRPKFMYKVKKRHEDIDVNVMSRITYTYLFVN